MKGCDCFRIFFVFWWVIVVIMMNVEQQWGILIPLAHCTYNSSGWFFCSFLDGCKNLLYCCSLLSRNRVDLSM